MTHLIDRYLATRLRFGLLRFTLPSVLFLLFSAPLTAQLEGIVVRDEIFVGSELENYFRILQTTGTSPLYPWSIRSFSPEEVDHLLPRDSVHPWAGRYAFQPDTADGFRADWIRPEAQMIFNSAFPYGGNDGPIWAGRGLTTALQFGFSVRYGPFSVVVAPMVFRSENAEFDLMPNGHTGDLAFADGRNPAVIDSPQRFGSDPYVRFDPGQTTARLDVGPIAAGVSTANQHWGPASEYPILLGDNAPGFLHGFLGTSHPLNLWIAKVHGRLVWGRLNQSEYSLAAPDSTRRFMSGIVGVLSPRGVPGLEIGGGRFFHTPWPRDGISRDDFLKPVEAFWKESVEDNDDPVIPGDTKSDADNQLASAFFRWVFPRSGAEVYGEYGREDHSYDRRDFTLEPDHSAGYMLGFRKAWERPDSSIVALRGELLDLQLSHIARVRYQAPFYVHGFARQGHTQRGQILGSPAGYGGAASMLAADLYHPGGRWTVAWRREVRQDRGFPWREGEADYRGLDVVHSLGAEALFFRGRFDVTTGLIGAYNFNRNFEEDAFNLSAVLRVEAGI